ncbi:hypothetical protein VNO77_37465 [Canavalia gladiata]|uniref:Uncharacterized protein n=1 Tax=Canavalia gladiata TaxID=3824 RepID=A0AAN9K8W2_CANGL
MHEEEDILKKGHRLSSRALVVDSIQTVGLKPILGSASSPGQHNVDVVLYMEGERHSLYRMLRAVENRFGSTDGLGVLEMSQSGLQAISNASEMFLTEQHYDSNALPEIAIVGKLMGSQQTKLICLHVFLQSKQADSDENG